MLEFDRDATGELGNLGKKILQKQFEAHNKVWLGALQEEYASHGYNSNMIGGSMMGNGGNSGGEYYGDNRVSLSEPLMNVFNIELRFLVLM